MGGVVDKGEALHQRCAERGWRSRRVGHELYLFEESTNYLVRVADTLLGPLVASPTGSLEQCVAEALHGETGKVDAQPGPEWVVPLTLLGVRVDVYCDHEACAEGIASYFSATYQPKPLASPEIIVRCTRPEADRLLFRARDLADAGTALDGVTVAPIGEPPTPWTSTNQPLPPLDIWPFRDRFIALHAAAVRSTSGDGILLAGDRGAGKTTAALRLAVSHGADLLSDETAFIGCRTNVIQPFPHAVGLWKGDHKVQVPLADVCTSVCLQAIPATRIIFLNRAEGQREIRKVSPEESLRHLLRHHRHAGASDGDAMTTLLGLAAELDAWAVSYEHHEELGDAVSGLCP